MEKKRAKSQDIRPTNVRRWDAVNGMATRSCVGRGTTRSCASRNRNTVAAVFLPVRVLVPVPVGVAPARPVRSTGTIPVHLLPSALLSYPVQVQRSLRVQMAQRGHLHIQVSTFSSRSDGLAAVVQLCRGGGEASRNGVPLCSPIQTTAPTSTKTRGLAFHPFAPFLRREAGGRQKLADQSCICLVSQGGLLICISGVGTRRNKLAEGGSVLPHTLLIPNNTRCVSLSKTPRR